MYPSCILPVSFSGLGYRKDTHTIQEAYTHTIPTINPKHTYLKKRAEAKKGEKGKIITGFNALKGTAYIHLLHDTAIARKQAMKKRGSMTYATDNKQAEKQKKETSLTG